MENGTTASTYHSDDASISIPADGVPSAAIPSVDVEPVSGQLVKQRKKTGPKPIETTMRMELLMQFINGDMPCGELGRLDFIRVCQLTPREKSYLVNHACFKELYDARLFDFFMGLEMVTKEDLKLMEIVSRRVGLAKPTTQLNVQVNNNNQDKDSKRVSIRVRK